MLTLVLIVVLTALVFEYINGFHDTANAVATVIYTKAMPPHLAVFFSGIFNFLGVLLGALGWALAMISIRRLGDSGIHSNRTLNPQRHQMHFWQTSDRITEQGDEMIREAWRQLAGGTDPVAKATPGTIRGDFALTVGENIVHGSDSPESAEREIAIWFPNL